LALKHDLLEMRIVSQNSQNGIVVTSDFLTMTESIHVRLESLTGQHRATGAQPHADLHATFYIETFGCQMNDHDSEKVAGLLLRRGYRQVDSPEAARLVFYNTCNIREKATQKVFSRLGLFNPKNDLLDATEKIIGVLGCVAQQEGERIFDRAPWVSLVCGSASYRKLPLLLSQLEAGQRRVNGLQTDTDETFETELTQRDHPFRAYLTIIEGCDKACAYCVVPFTRGPERSRASASILREVRELADVGYTEVQLLGQTVNSYRDPSPQRLSFAELLAAVAEVPGIRRVRFTTSHPRDLTGDIVAAMDARPAICNHIHLPMQSGSTRILRAMQRTYTRDEYFEKLGIIQGARRPISVTSDFIVGFPGETEADFEETLSALDIAQFDGTFSFQYSPRPNTPALNMPGAVPEPEKARRLRTLQERQGIIQTARNESLIGRTFEVLVEAASRRESQWSGRTSSNRMLNFTSPHSGLLGEYVQARVTSAGANTLTGEQAD
jgi:tRNA-2-methylthio-N6-dimethylallyladenosine synthase